MKRVGARPLLLIAMTAIGLAGGCTGVDPTLGLASVSAPRVTTPPAVVASPAATSPGPASSGPITVAFAPVTGIDPGASNALADGLSASAAENGVALSPAGDTSARYTLKGYLSAIAEAQDTTVVYVFDVLDNGGTRLHRIQGTENSPGNGGWSTVRPETMKRIAARTLGELSTWAAGHSG